MKILLIALTLVSTAMARDLSCTSNSTAKALKSFEIQDFFGKAHSTQLDGVLLDGKEFHPTYVEYFITNECDNGFTFKFPLRRWRLLAEGRRANITATVDYEYPGRVGEDEVQEGKATVYCHLK